MKKFQNFNKSINFRGFIFVYITALLSLQAQSPSEDLFEKGNLAYNKGDYKNAISFYEKNGFSIIQTKYIYHIHTD